MLFTDSLVTILPLLKLLYINEEMLTDIMNLSSVLKKLAKNNNYKIIYQIILLNFV